MTTTQIAPFDELSAALRGEVIMPADPRYDEVRAVYNGMIDKRPAAIARCRDVADVLACVRFGREYDVTLAVRSGGHSASGLGVWNDALVVDLSLMRSTTVDPEHRTVRVDPGATLGDLDHATGAFGLAVPTGFIANTGIAGLALGGGVGYLTRKFGMTLDNMLAADVVLADGTFVTASEDSHADLFWALRGGGGNFGIVTSITFRCHPVGENGVIIGGPVLYDIADTTDVMRWYRDVLPTLPEELNGWFALLTIPPAPPFPEELWGRKACGVVWCYTVPHSRADEVLAPVREFGSPLVMGLAPMPFSALQSAFDPLYPSGLQWYLRSDVLPRSPTPRSRCTVVTASVCPPATRPCTCTRSTARQPACRRTRRRSRTATAAGSATSSGSTRTRPTPRRSRSGPAITGLTCTRCRPEEPMSTS
jgi:FAD binding domain